MEAEQRSGTACTVACADCPRYRELEVEIEELRAQAHLGFVVIRPVDEPTDLPPNWRDGA